MKKLLSNQKGVTLIETLAATVIIVLLLGTLLGALVFGQKVIIGSDEKNRAAAEAQEIIDSLMEDLSSNSPKTDRYSCEWFKKESDFKSAQKNNLSNQTKLCYILPLPLDKIGNSPTDKKLENAYNVYVRVYYNQGEAFVDLSAYVKKGGVGD